MGQEDKTGKLKQKARPKKSVVKGTESEAGQAAVKHGVKQRENPEQQVESIELIDKQVKEKEETLRQKQHEIKSGDGVKRGHLTCGDCGVQGCFGPCNWCGQMLCDYCTSDHYWWHTTGRNH